MADSQSAGERELAALIVTALNLEGVAPEDIDPQAPLFKTGLGLDSIDALELALEISKRYGFQLRCADFQLVAFAGEPYRRESRVRLRPAASVSAAPSRLSRNSELAPIANSGLDTLLQPR
jgi:acyl carrier protein